MSEKIFYKEEKDLKLETMPEKSFHKNREKDLKWETTFEKKFL